MTSFRSGDGGEIRAVFTTQEVEVLKNLTEQLIELLGDSELHTSDLDGNQDPLMNLMGISTSDSPPEDPVLRRLFPDGYQGQEEAAEFRRYTEHGLREKKRSNAYLIYESITSAEEENVMQIEANQFGDSLAEITDHEMKLAIVEILIREIDANAWLSGLNDLRLALAVRLGIGQRLEPEENNGETGFELMRESDPMQAVYAVYSWLGWLQQSLLEVMMDAGDDHQAT